MEPNRDVPARSRQSLLCLLILLIANLAGVIGTSCVQFLHRRIPDFELGAYRYCIQLLVSVLFAWFSGTTLKIHPQFYGWMAVLITAHIHLNIGLFAGTGLIHLTAVKSTFDLSKVIAVAGLSRFVCKRNVGKIQILTAIICISGVLLIWQPWLGGLPSGPGITTNITRNTTNFDNHIHGHGEVSDTIIGYGAVIIAGVAVSIYFLTTSMPLFAVDTVSQITWVAMAGLPVSGLISVYFESPVVPNDMDEILFILAHCFCTTFYLFACTYASRIIGPLRTAFVTNFGGVLYLISQYTVMKDVMPGHQNWVEIMGALLTTLGVVIMPAASLFIEWRTSKLPPIM